LPRRARPQPAVDAKSREAACLAQFTPQRVAALRRRIRGWHPDHGRALPWRASGDPYRVWISEIMLQQTTVAAVKPYYERFLAAFPSVRSLASADESAVLRQWEGLGYYSRGRNLHRAARIIVDRHQGRLPDSVEELQRLPGIGRYTASAIASFAFGRPEPIVEANTLRLYSRLLGYDGDPRSSSGQRLLWEFGAKLVPDRAPGEFNQALLDLGAGVCTSAAPACDRCPLRESCIAFRDGTQRSIPRAAPRPQVTELLEAVVVIEHNGRFLLRRCVPDERWAGLWDFPRVGLPLSVAPASRLTPHSSGRIDPLLVRETGQQVESLTGIRVELGPAFGELRHTVTRYRIRLLCLRGKRVGGRLRCDSSSPRWVPLPEIADLPLSSTGRQIADRWIRG
jgi:A/G-specific adenine glycosylase